MATLKLNVGIAMFPYAGVSGGSAQVYDITPWAIRTVAAAKADPRVGEVYIRSFNDTPITMTRNQAVVWARKMNIDVLIMVDSDMTPDVELGKDARAKPFFETAFHFIHEHWSDGPHVVCAPYCGPPPDSLVYCFQWKSGYESEDAGFALEMIQREVAAMHTGIGPIAAAPTGLIAFDVRAFELTDPVKVGGPGWFYYEWTDEYRSEKASTEDVTATRDMSLAAMVTENRNILFAAWDCWAGHNKNVCVGKPRVIYANHIAEKFRAAVLNDLPQEERILYGQPEKETPNASGDLRAEARLETTERASRRTVDGSVRRDQRFCAVLPRRNPDDGSRVDGTPANVGADHGTDHARQRQRGRGKGQKRR